MNSELGKLLPLLWAFAMIFFSLYKRLNKAASPQVKNVYTGYAFFGIVFVALQVAALHFNWQLPWG